MLVITVFIVESLERFFFFRRVASSLKADMSFVFVTSEPLVFIKALAQGFSARLVLSKKPIAGSVSCVDKAIEVLNGEFSREQAQMTAQGLMKILNRLNQQYGVAKVVCWNGQNILGLAATDFSRECKIPTRFLELSNLPGKCFSDPLGVNAKSGLALNPAMLDDYADVNSVVHEKWVAIYKGSKKGALPQAKLSNKGVKLLNYLLKFLYPAANHHSLKRFSKVASLLPGQDYSVDDTGSLVDFVFYPMQVSSDTQIKLNSTVNNLDAIQSAYNKSVELGKSLVVKVHPAEVSQIEVDEMLKMKATLSFFVSNENTIDLLEKSAQVVTINSTVGLEAMVLGKPVVVLGRALYKDFDASRLKKYIHNFLVSDVDYFSNKKIERQAALKLLGMEIVL